MTGRELCMILYEQGVLPMDETQYNNLASGATGAYDFLRGKLQTLEITPGQLGLEPCRGSVVITDADSGDVLACVSYPGYDNNRLANTMDSDYYNELNTSTSRPFYNSATQETTAPGSTYKPLVAVAGLTEGVIDTGTTVYCDGNFDVISPEVHCWVYPAGHGTMNVVSGITNSCNEFFNNIGYQLGMQDGSYSSEYGLERLRKYAEMFGLGETSGLEIPEMDPKISDEDSVRSAMGQGTNNYTTSQLARYITAVANEGTLYELTLLDWIEDHKGCRKYVAIAGKCWPAFQTQFGFVPCYVNSRLTGRGIPVSCEVDIYGALSEYIGTLASNDAVTLLDINNTVPADLYQSEIQGKYGYTQKDTFMGFHCGNTTSGKLTSCTMKYQMIMARTLPEEVTQGTLEGDIVPGDVTFYRLQSTSDCKLRAYIAHGEVLPVATQSFGGIGIFAIPEMGRFYRHVLVEKNYPHHGAVAFGHYGKALYEVFKYIGVEVEEINYNQPKGVLYPTENPFA